MRCTGMRRYWNEERVRSTKLDLVPPEKIKETKNDELEAPLVSSRESPDKNLKEKEWRGFHNKMDTRLRNLSP